MHFDQPALHPVANEEINAKLNTDALIELIRKLPTGYQTIFNLVAMEGYNHVEAEKLLGMNENTCRSQYSRAKAMLIRWINQEQSNAVKKMADAK